MVECPQRGQKAPADRFAPKELEIALARVRGQLRGLPEEPEAEPPGLRRPPGAGEVVVAQRVQRLVRHHGQAP